MFLGQNVSDSNIFWKQNIPGDKLFPGTSYWWNKMFAGQNDPRDKIF